MKVQKDQRRSARYHCRVPVESKKGAAFDNSQTIDIGKSGIGIISNKSIPLDTKMAVELDLNAEGESVLAVGYVKWVRRLPDSQSYRVGMKFEEISKTTQLQIEERLRR